SERYRELSLRTALWIANGEWSSLCRLHADVGPPRPGSRRCADSGPPCRLADEVRYIQRHAANHRGRIVTVGQLVLFSTETGDAWLLDPADQLARGFASFERGDVSGDRGTGAAGGAKRTRWRQPRTARPDRVPA